MIYGRRGFEQSLPGFSGGSYAGEVTADSTLQRFGLADVERAAVDSAEDVHARQRGQIERSPSGQLRPPSRQPAIVSADHEISKVGDGGESAFFCQAG